MERKTVSNDGKAVTIWTVVGALMAVGAVVGFLTTLWGDVGDIREVKESVKAEKQLPSLEELMPEFRVVTNEHAKYVIQFKTIKMGGWARIDEEFETGLEAQATIDEAKLRLTIEYEVNMSIIRALREMRGSDK